MKPSILFSHFVFRQHKRTVLAIGALLVLQFMIFKNLYPYAIVTYDSTFYIDAAARGLSINYWPIGYSQILRLLHAVVKADWMVVAFQFLLLEGTVLFFYFTLIYFLRPGKWVSRVMLLLMAANPLLLIISNHILSDSIFTALTILWFTLLLWILFRPNEWQVYLSVIVLFLLYTIRYYAIFYPIFTVVVVLNAKINWKTKAAGLGLGLLLFLSFMYYTAGEYGKLLGRREFSPFSGWRLAENALIMYSNVEDHAQDVPPASLQPLHRFITHRLDSIRAKATLEAPRVYYDMMDSTDLLVNYMRWEYRNDTTTGYFSKWAAMGKLYDQYGNFLIKRHPMSFARYYIGQNILWYMLPIMEIANEYDTGEYGVPPQVAEWFGYSSNVLTCTTSTLFSTKNYLFLLTIFNGLMFLSALSFFIFGCYKRADDEVRKAVLLAGAFWVANFIFTVLATPAMLRYGLPIMILNTAFGLIQAEWVWRMDEKIAGKPSL